MEKVVAPEPRAPTAPAPTQMDAIGFSPSVQGAHDRKTGQKERKKKIIITMLLLQVIGLGLGLGLGFRNNEGPKLEGTSLYIGLLIS